MSVIGVLAEADVGPEEKLGLRRLDGPERAGNDPLRVVRFAPLGILLLGDAEENEAAHAERCELPGFLDHEIDRELGVPRHGSDRPAHALAVADEEGRHQGARRQRGLANQRAQRFGRAEAAHAGGGEAHRLTPADSSTLSAVCPNPISPSGWKRLRYPCDSSSDAVVGPRAMTAARAWSRSRASGSRSRSSPVTVEGLKKAPTTASSLRSAAVSPSTSA